MVILVIMCFVSSHLFFPSFFPAPNFADAQTTDQNRYENRFVNTNSSVVSSKTEDLGPSSDFITYKNSVYGFEIKYPSNWVNVNPNSSDNYYDRIVSINENIAAVAKFSSPTKDNVTISIARLEDDTSNKSDNIDNNQTSNVEQFINSIINGYRQEFAEFQALDLKISPNLALSSRSDDRLNKNNTNDSTTPKPIIYNLTYTAIANNDTGNSTFPIRGLEVGSILNNTAYIISFIAAAESYNANLPEVVDTIDSFEITSPISQSANFSSTFPGDTAKGTPTSPPSATNNFSSTNVLPAGSGSTQPYTMANIPNPFSTYPYGYPAPQYMTNMMPYTNPYNFPINPYNFPINPYNFPINPYNFPINPILPPGQNYYPTIVSYNTYNDTTGIFHIVGEVENTTPATINSVQVIASFYDNLNQLLSTKFAYTNPSSIGTGQRALFDLTLPPRTIPVERVSQWTLNLIWQ